MDDITREVIEEVDAAFPDNPGDLSRFCYAVTPEAAQAQFDWFCEHALPLFGTYQDGLAEESPWLFGFFPKGFSLHHAWLGNVKPHLMANNTLKYKRVDGAKRRAAQQSWNPSHASSQ